MAKDVKIMRPNGGGGGSRWARENQKPQNRKKSLKRLLSYLSDFKALVSVITIIVIIYSGLTIYSNIVVKNLVKALGTYNSDTFVFEILPDEKQFFTWLIVLGASWLIICISRYFMSLLTQYLALKIVKKMRNELFEKIVHLPIGYLDTHAHGDIMSRMTNDIDNVSNAISQSLSSLVSGILTIIGCLAIMIWFSPLLTTVSFIVLFLTIALSLFMSKFARPLFKRQQAVLGRLNTVTEETVSGYKTVMAYNHQDENIESFNSASDDFTRTGVKSQILGGSMGPMMNFIGNVGYFLVCLLGAYCVIKGIGKSLVGEPLTVATVIMFLTTTKQFTRPINEIANLYTSLISALAGAERVFSILDEKSEDFSGTEDLKCEDVKGTIQFHDVNFSYVEGKPVIQNFTTDIYAGHKIALVGATGSGKTTIVNLLLRYYNIDSGEILIDGKNIANVPLKEIRDAISIVLQDPVLFSDTIANNVKYGRQDATDEEVDKALEFANCTHFVSQLPEGKDTILTEGATNISQGQRQLITIARAVIANPKILILDEATSSVDTRTEKNIQDAMMKLMENRTSIIIAHRLSTIQDADFILVLDQGHIVEMGNHKELLQIEGGIYRKLYETQFKGLQT